MALHGSLSTMNVADLLQVLAVGKKSGFLKLSHGKVVKGVYFENGIIVGSSTNDPREYLGQVLLHYGKIDEAQLKTAMEAQRQTGAHRRLGTILVEDGLLTEEDVRSILQLRTLEIIYELFLWKDGHFEFCIVDALPPDFTRVYVEPTKVIMEGVYRSDELARFRTLIPSDRSVMELGAGWTSSLGLGKNTRQLLYFLEKRMSVAEICYSMHASPFEIYSELYELVQKGLARVAGELPQASSSELPDDATELLDTAREELQKQNAEHALSLIHDALKMEPNNSEAHQLLTQAEQQFVAQVYAHIPPQSIPKTVIAPEELANKEIEPQEGFVLSRINGLWDIQSILSICPFREADSLRMIKKLRDNGIIGF